MRSVQFCLIGILIILIIHMFTLDKKVGRLQVLMEQCVMLQVDE